METNKNMAEPSENKHLDYDDINRISFEIIKVLHENRCTYEDTTQVIEFLKGNLGRQLVQVI